MKVAAYIRVSTEEQASSGLGLEAQMDKIKGYCALYDGLEVVATHQDAASGKTVERDGLRAALAMLERGEAEGLIVAKLDRLTRSVRDLGVLLEGYFSRHSLFVVCEQVDTRTASGRLVLNMLMSVAQWERETISERTRDALKAKKRRGEKTGGSVPYGFDVAEGGRLVPNSQEQEVIRMALKMRAARNSYHKIAKALNDGGISAKSGGKWEAMTVMRILKRQMGEERAA